jgi:uncharacterized protein
MKIGVLSDTHITGSNSPGTVASLCSLLEPYFNDVRAILHAGDISDLSVIESLEQFGRVYAVAGNTDKHDIYTKYGDSKIIDINGFNIGLIHGWGSHDGMSNKVRDRFQNDDVNCIVFGHTHFPYNRVEENVLMFNPGSPVQPRYSSKRSIGILHLNGKNISGEHIII